MATKIRKKNGKTTNEYAKKHGSLPKTGKKQARCQPMSRKKEQIVGMVSEICCIFVSVNLCVMTKNTTERHEPNNSKNHTT